jgi:hypothetical protein
LARQNVEAGAACELKMLRIMAKAQQGREYEIGVARSYETTYYFTKTDLIILVSYAYFANDCCIFKSALKHRFA